MQNAHTEVLEVEQPASLSHLVHVLKAYRVAMLFSLVAVAVCTSIAALVFYLISPSQRVISIPFRLQFNGAAAGLYPNGLRFSTNDIISAPVLGKVYAENNLKPYADKVDSFTSSIFILQANSEYEKLAAAYQARLADPRLSPVDRERMEGEFQAKRDALSKNEFSINYIRASGTAKLPPAIAQKVLLDTLSEWANHAAVDQKMLQYRVAVLSPDIMDQSGSLDPQGNYMVAVQVLRSKLHRVLANIDEINELPGAQLVRTKDKISLAEVRLRIEEIIRFRLEPLATMVRNSPLIGDKTATVQFVQDQLAYDQRQLRAAQDQVEATRQALALYMNQHSAIETAGSGMSGLRMERAANGSVSSDGATPQLSETFIDRLMQLTNQSTDNAYRQRMVDTMRRDSVNVIPLQEAVAYDQQLLDSVRGGSAGGGAITAQKATAEIDTARAEARDLVRKMNDIFDDISRNLNPSTQLYAVTAPPTESVQRTTTLGRLLLYVILVTLASIPVTFVLCLLHNRVREEEAEATIDEAEE